MDLKSDHPFWPAYNGLLHSYPTLQEDEICDVIIWTSALWLPVGTERIVAGTVGDARALVLERLPDLLVIYLDLPGGDPLELVRQGKKEGVPALVFGGQVSQARQALDHGATGYLDVRDSPEEITAALLEVMQRRIYLSRRRQQAVLGGLQTLRTKGKKRLAVESLIRAEKQVWEGLSQGKKTRVIAENRGVTVKTVETHIQRILVKLGVTTLTELRQLASRWLE